MNMEWWYLEKQRSEIQGKWEREKTEEWRRFESYDHPLGTMKGPFGDLEYRAQMQSSTDVESWAT